MNRAAGSAAVLLGLSLCGLAETTTWGQEKAQPPAVQMAQVNGKWVFGVVNLAPQELAVLAEARWEAGRWAKLFNVRVAGDAKAKETDLPPVLGSYRVEGAALRFEPRFPLTPGLRYRVVFDPAKLPGRVTPGEKRLQRDFELPKPKAAATTVVERVYPTANKLPENQLKFYVHFSAPMSRGEAYERVQLLDAAGKPIDHPFLELDEELWDPRGRRFTLFFHPGRVKRGLKPREDLGPILEEGKTYTLVIDRRWNDAQGNPLKESYRKTFKVLPPDDTQPDPKAWKIEPPPAGTTVPLAVRFPKPLDHALLERMLWVAAADGNKVAGAVTTAEAETVWRFTPATAWRPGAYRLVADTRLEDLAGNSIGRPFEVDVFRRVEREVKAETVRVPFQVSRPRP